MLFFFKIWRHQREKMICVLIVNGCCGVAGRGSGNTTKIGMCVCFFLNVFIERQITDKL